MVMDGGNRCALPPDMSPNPLRPHHPPPRSSGLPDPGGLPEAIVQVVDVATDPDVLDFLGHAVDGVGAVVGALGDLSP